MIVVTFFTTFFQQGKQDQVARSRGAFLFFRPGPGSPKWPHPPDGHADGRRCRMSFTPCQQLPLWLWTAVFSGSRGLRFPSLLLACAACQDRDHGKNFSFATGRARRKTYLEDASERDAAKAFTDTVFISPRRIHICPKSSASTLGPPTPVSTSWKARTPSASPILRAAAPLPPWWLSPIRNAWWARSPNVRP